MKEGLSAGSKRYKVIWHCFGENVGCSVENEAQNKELVHFHWILSIEKEAPVCWSDRNMEVSISEFQRNCPEAHLQLWNYGTEVVHFELHH